MMMDKVKRTESSEDTESTTTASRRDSEDSDSGVNLSEREVTVTSLKTPGNFLLYSFTMIQWLIMGIFPSHSLETPPFVNNQVAIPSHIGFIIDKEFTAVFLK